MLRLVSLTKVNEALSEVVAGNGVAGSGSLANADEQHFLLLMASLPADTETVGRLHKSWKCRNGIWSGVLACGTPVLPAWFFARFECGWVNTWLTWPVCFCAGLPCNRPVAFSPFRLICRYGMLFGFRPILFFLLSHAHGLDVGLADVVLDVGLTDVGFFLLLFPPQSVDGTGLKSWRLWLSAISRMHLGHDMQNRNNDSGISFLGPWFAVRGVAVVMYALTLAWAVPSIASWPFVALMMGQVSALVGGGCCA
ncbi:hypothetical protein Nepgr_033604 [Nepenthes gracilis]|uniref:Uncharacterized protein n=1 Tax=Nepenthes gracilis TaxID=150966 RepID=A0AAD3TKR4_NEPGR|nr:hypothetical protein Nepgr_033604 [Nepenthes gracilis]